MSSILDALNKVEEDRNARDASDENAPFVPEKAADALCGKAGRRKRDAWEAPSFHWKPLLYATGGAIVLALIVGLSAAVALLVGKNGMSTTAVAAAKPAAETPAQTVATATQPPPAPEPATTPALPEPQPKPEMVPVTQPEAPSVPTPPVATQAPIPESVKLATPPAAPVIPEPETKTPEPVKAPVEPPVPAKPAVSAVAKAPAPEPEKVVAEKPAPKPVAAPVKVARVIPPPLEEPTTPLPTMDELSRARAAVSDAESPSPPPKLVPPTSLAPGREAEKRAPFLEDLNALPRLGQTDRERLGLGEMRLNVLREASASQPEGLAIINLKKVYVGEMIPGTGARLIAVKTRAIAIEIEGTGERFKVMN